MKRLTTEDLCSLGEYSQIRPEFRTRVIARKRHRNVPIGAHLTLHFENRLTMHYQVQEMLRAERIFEADGIQSELDAYNALIPDGSNWKATMMIEYEDVNERRDALTPGQMPLLTDGIVVGDCPGRKIGGGEPCFLFGSGFAGLGIYLNRIDLFGVDIGSNVMIIYGFVRYFSVNMPKEGNGICRCSALVMK